MTDYLFVYGSLKKGKKLHYLISELNFIGRGILRGFDMYLVSWYPAVVKGSGKVFGEIYEINEEVLKILDKVEDEGKLYNRTVVNIETEWGELLPAYIYIYNGSIENLEKIPSGNF